VDKSTIRELVEFMEKHPEVGVAGPIMYFLSDPKRIWCAGVKRNYWTTITRLIGFNTRDDGQFREPYESEDFPNAFMVRREVLEKVGLFNSKLFPIHYDEGDFCQRVRKAGYKVMVVPTAKVWHDIPLPEHNRASTLHLKSSLRAYYASRNRIIFHWKWSRNVLQRIVALIASLAVTLYYVMTVARDPTVRDKRGVIVSILRGVLDAFRIMSRGEM
jgi:GT2 family glycosyltransferase